MLITIKESEIPNKLPAYQIDAIFPDFVNYGLINKQTLDILIKLFQSVGARTLFEFGTWEGKNTKILSAFFDKIYTIDLPLEDLRDINAILKIQRGELRPKAWIGKFCRDCSNVVQLYGDTSLIETITNIRNTIEGQIDAVSIDANHSYSYVLCDSITALSIAKKIIVWDDVHHGPVPGVTKALEILPFDVYHIQDSHIGFYLV